MTQLPREQPRWRFAQMTPSEINQDPVQGEFFSRESDLPGRLVREAIQNSMDARRDGETVRVRFTFSGDRGALSPEKAARYLDGLEEHVEAVVEGSGRTPVSDDDDEVDEEGEVEAAYDALAHFGAPMSYLAIEDFGTTGLTGDIRENSRREAGNHFWGFFRSIGISPKGADDAGSWGLGKWVFPDASIINAYLGMTQRHGENNWLLMGMALLMTHELSDKYRPYGFFAVHSDEDDTEWFPMPVDSSADPDDFILTALDDFKLERMDDPGLSVIVPYPKRELTPDAIARAVLTQYFLPIVRGDLVVEIVHAETGKRTIDASTIDGEIGRIKEPERDDESAESLLGAVKLARWAVKQNAAEHIEAPLLAKPGETTKNKEPIKEAMEARGDLAELRERYERGEPLAFRLTLDVRERGQAERSPAKFQVYLERDEELHEGHDYFVRGDLRIPRMDHIKRQKARALVLVEASSDLGRMLRDAEGPAHESWSEGAQRLKENWIGGRARVNSVRNAARRLLEALVERPDAESFAHVLARWFPRRIGGKEPPPPPPPPPPPSQRGVEIVATKDGFEVRSAKGAERLAGKSWTILFAYDSTGRGGPFKQFLRSIEDGQPDFSIAEGGNLQIGEVNGCDYTVTKENEFLLNVESDTFRIAVSGFDPRRDVIVDTQPVPDSVSDAEEGPTE